MKKKYLNNIIKIISILYLLFIFYLLITNLYNFNLYNIIGIIFSIIILVLNKNKLNKKVFIILLIIGFISRLSLLFLDYQNILGDYSFFYGSSVSLSKNLELNNSYIALFPYLYSYIFVVGNIMKLISTKYISVIITNLIFEMIGGIFFCLLIKKLNKYDIKKSMILYIYNPFNILWVTICAPIVVTNTLLILCIYMFYLLKNTTNTYKKIIISILFGIILAIANAFRPIIIVLFIALFIFIIFNYLKTKKIFLNNIYSIFITVSIYIFSTIIINFYIEREINIDKVYSKSGWSLYVGANYDNKGMWNEKDSNYLNKIYKNNDNISTHDILKREAIKRYKKLNIKTIPLFVYKSIILTNDTEIYTYDTYDSLRNNKVKDIFKIITNISLNTYMYYILIANLTIIKKNIKNKKDTLLFPIGIFAIGLFLSSLLVEISPRYFMPITIPLIIYSIQIFKKQEIK